MLNFVILSFASTLSYFYISLILKNYFHLLFDPLYETFWLISHAMSNFQYISIIYILSVYLWIQICLFLLVFVNFASYIWKLHNRWMQIWICIPLWWIDLFILKKYLSVYLVILLILKSILPSIIIATPTFFWLVY